jgi:hypothetical protein
MDKLLTIADLAVRWGCKPETAMDKVRDKGVPFVWLGRGEPRLKAAGQKFIRFRPEAIAAFERAQEHVWAEPAPSAAASTPGTPRPRRRGGASEGPEMSPFLRAIGWDGKVR